MDADYMLIHSVDPTKIKVNIKDKFAKLTLSSNKKKQQMDDEKADLVHDQINKRISRNLLEDFGITTSNKMENKDCYINPILRSDSSSQGTSNMDNSEPKDNTSNSINLDLEKSTQMEPLQISDDSIFNTQNTDDNDCLMKKLSELTLSNQLVPGKSLNPESAKDEFSINRNISCSMLDPDVTIISSTDEEESTHAITISDTSQEEIYEIVTSNIPQSGETADAFLPDTFSNDKADRMEAFLRDVSQEQRHQEIGIKSEYRHESLIEDKSHHNISSNNDTWANVNEEVRIKNMATADTESMSQDCSEIGNDKSQLDINDTVPMTQPMSLTEYNSQMTEIGNDTHVNDNTSGMRLADQDTIANTTTSSNRINCSVSESTINQSTHLDSFVSDHQQTSLLPDESITISETSSEDEAGHDRSPTPSNKISEDVKTEENDLNSLSSYSDTSDIQNGVTSVNISAKINIKIHVSHQVSSEENSLEEALSDNNNSNTDSVDDIQNDCSISDNGTSSKEDAGSSHSNYYPIKSKAKKPEPLKNIKNDCNIANKETSVKGDGGSPHSNSPENNSKNDETFVEHAQKLLNQLYGKSWQTPEVLRTLHRTMTSSKKQSIECDINKQPSKTNKEANDVEDVLPEDSVLDDFSIFRRNIKTTLDSTRKVESTPTRRKQKAVTNKINQNNQLKTFPDKKKEHFKMPPVDGKKRTIPRRCAGVNERWRDLIDDDSRESICNASDDEDANKTNDDSLYTLSANETSNGSDCSDDSDCGVKKRTAIKKQTKSRIPKKDSKSDNRTAKGKQNKLVYLDLSKDEIEIIDGTPCTPQANNDANFNTRLQSILGSCKFEGKPVLEATPKTIKKRKLFTAKFGSDEEDAIKPVSATDENKETLEKENVRFNWQPMPAKFDLINKQLEAVRTGNPIFKISTPGSKEKSTVPPEAKNSPSKNSTPAKTPGEKKSKSQQKYSESIQLSTPRDKYGFLKSLDVCVAKSVCHPDALYYRDNYRQKKEELAEKLYKLYNEKLFNNELDVPLLWNKKLINTAGRCLNKKKLGIRSSVVELSEKVLTSTDRLRCTLIHELCHAASWIFNGEGGHGATWKSWAHKANATFPEIPKIGVCHQYEIEYKYTYKCTLCGAKSHAHSKSKKVENIRCSYCHGAIEVFLNKKDKDGNIMPTPVKEPTGFAKFVKEKYKEYKRPDLKHADIMKILSNEFAAMKVANAN